MKTAITAAALAALAITLTGAGVAARASDRDPLHRYLTRECSSAAVVSECREHAQIALGATRKYVDHSMAVADGFVAAGDCVQTADGAMGQHWVNVERLDDPRLDPALPEILLYVPTVTGMRLVAAEWAIDEALASSPPRLFGRGFDGPMDGHEHVGGVPVTLQGRHYDLHVWLWAHNPDGLFAHYNPEVSCDPLATPPSRLEFSACHEVLPFIAVPPENVRPFVPSKFTLQTNEQGKATVIVRTASCGVSVDGGLTAPTRPAQLGTLIEAPPGSEAAFNVYMFFWVDDNRAVVDWLRGEPGIGTKAVSGHTAYALGLGDALSFRAPEPAPSPFTMTGIARGPLLGPAPISIEWWSEHPLGAVRFHVDVELIRFGFGRVTVTPDDREPDTPLEAMFAPDRSKTFPEPPIPEDAFTSNWFDRSVLTKEVVPCGDDC